MSLYNAFVSGFDVISSGGGRAGTQLRVGTGGAGTEGVGEGIGDGVDGGEGGVVVAVT